MKRIFAITATQCAVLMTAVAVGSAFPVRASASEPSLAPSVAQDAAQDSNAPSITGSWQLSFTSPQGDQRQASLQIQQKGSKLTGTFQGQRGSAPLSGSIQGNQVSLTVKAGGRAISLSGTVDGNKMSGTTAQGGPWSATRQ